MDLEPCTRCFGHEDGEACTDCEGRGCSSCGDTGDRRCRLCGGSGYFIDGRPGSSLLIEGDLRSEYSHFAGFY